MGRDGSFRCELEKSKNEDENRNQVTTIKCHGELVSNTVAEIKEVVTLALERWSASRRPQTSKVHVLLNSPT